jgi:type II secretory pathway pseudopilin PulG
MVTDWRRRHAILPRMIQPRRALSLVEVVVALSLIGVAGAALVAALVGDLRLRALASSHDGAAHRAHERLELLAIRSCSRDTSGSSVEVWGAELWRAAVNGRSWRLIDSASLRASRSVLAIDARIGCPE